MATATEVRDAIRDHLNERFKSGAVSQYTIGGRSITLDSIADIMKIEDRYLEYASQESASSSVTMANFSGSL